MATLAADKSRKYLVTGSDVAGRVPAVATDIIYQGAAVGDSSGTGRPLVGGDAFIGFANAKCDNSAGAASAVDIELRLTGEVELSVTGVASTDDIGAIVYATDDDTFTLTASGASSIGKVVRWVSGTTCVVRFEAASYRSI